MKRLPANKAFMLFYAFDFLLLLIIAVFLLPLSKNNNVQKSTKGCFLDSSIDKESITEIRILDKKNKCRITLGKINVSGSVFWIGTDSFSNDSLYWPADSKTVQNFLNEMTLEKNWTKKASNVTSWKKLGVDSANAVEIDFKSGDKSEGSVFFGYGDELTDEIYFRTSKEGTVWQTKTDAENFIYEKTPSFWADPYLVPLCALSDSEKNESGLRRGELAYIKPTEQVHPVKVIEKKLDSGINIKYSFYEKDDEIVVIPEFSGNEYLKLLTYRYTISQWTYERFLKELENQTGE